MPIESIEIKNYRLFRHAKFERLPELVVVVGANGSGKSTLFQVLSFLQASLAENVARAVGGEGGFQQLVSRGRTGPIEITLKFREERDKRLVTYHLEIENRNNRPVVSRELLQFRRGQRGKPWKFLDFREGRGMAITNESAYGEPGVDEERKDFELDDPSVLAIKGLGQFKEFRVVSEFRQLIEGWHISDFHIKDAKSIQYSGYAEHLSTQGENLAQVANYLFENHPERFQRILEAMRRRVPGVEGVEAKTTEDGRLVLRFRDGSFEEPFLSRHVSDGTMKMFAYLVLLYDPRPHKLLAIEEPENQLYPELLAELAEEFVSYARRGEGQVFVSTHSPDLLNGVKLSQIYWLVKRNGFSEARRASDDERLRRLEAEGDPPGALWRQRLFEGVGPA